MFEKYKIVPATKEPGQEVRESITDSVLYLVNLEEVELPTWLDRDFRNNDIFEKNLGFEQTFPRHNGAIVDEYIGTYLRLTQEAIDIRIIAGQLIYRIVMVRKITWLSMETREHIRSTGRQISRMGCLI